MNVNKLTAIQQADVFIRARYPGLFIRSQEEARVESAIRGLLATGKHAHKEVLTWTISRGVRLADAPAEEYGPTDPISALQWFAGYGVTEEKPAGTPAVAIFKDLDPYFQDPRVVRALRDLIADITSTQRTLIVISPTPNVPESCKRQVAMIDWALPTVDELAGMLGDFIADLPDRVQCDLNGDKEQVAKALCGLTWFQAQSVLATAVIATGKLDGAAIEFIISEKARLVRESGLLEFYLPDNLPDIGGLDELKTYISRRRRSFTDKARDYGVPTPKGLLLVGVPGCGKSLACKSLSKLWRLPLVRLDVGALMGSLVGQSEANLRQALQVAESSSPCILWLDEIEKGLAGVKSSGQTDGGTTARVFGALLTWLQEKTAPVYMVATSNDISALPAELLRAGRFDETFFVDLPNTQERREIWTIHVAKAGRNPANFDLEALVQASDGYTGAEIEAAVGDALIAGFDQDREITTGDLVTAIAGRVPLTETMDTQINALRKWAARRAKPASSAQAGQAESKSRAATLDL